MNILNSCLWLIEEGTTKAKESTEGVNNHAATDVVNLKDINQDSFI
jgi:hypothetical protein